MRRPHHRPTDRDLSAEAHRVLSDLRRDGVARTTLTALTGGPTLLADVLSRTDDLIADQSADIVRRRRYVAGDPVARCGPGDPHRVELLGDHPPVDPEDPYARFLRHPAIAGVATAYCRRDVRIWDMNGLLTLASAPAREDDWGRSVEGAGVEVHLHLTGVDDGVGPLSYVRTSHRRRGRVRGLERTGRRIGDEDLGRVFGTGCTTTLTGAAGTVVFVDPRGLHRRARPTARDRLLLQGRYSPRGGRERAVLLPAEEVPRSALADFALA
ncbi:hypothetical protein [Kineococcus rhizosphaerae]|uniref:Phytanoyl-CoA dioxygenase PhyH n=1 Tax=Kineococcus rhizosphaerae TaxID=559628 RepID=A0A2T0R287_9ACTN|nr:hypothetical protein [Kineococcus rhizosphaerae]PRY13916.1 hypothetical protein CLV37_10734 [Kineococcus rhizosphaerae]